MCRGRIESPGQAGHQGKPWRPTFFSRFSAHKINLTNLGPIPFDLRFLLFAPPALLHSFPLALDTVQLNLAL